MRREDAYCEACSTTGITAEKEHGHSHGILSYIDREELYTIIGAGIILAVGLIIENLFYTTLLSNILFILVIAISGREIIVSAIKNVLKKRITINLLMTIAAVGSFAIGHGEEGATVVYLFYIAETIEKGAIRRTHKSLEYLLKLSPKKARVKRGEKEAEIDVEDVNVNDILVIRPGDVIPLDGVVVNGASSVDESPITGEYIPAYKRTGDKIYAGSKNIDGYLEIEVTKRSGERLIDRIVKLVEEARTKKSRTERFVDKFSKYYTPSVIVLAILTATVPTLIFQQALEVWIYRALVLLVIACPCALVISTPVTILSSLIASARQGVLVKGGIYIEEMNKIRVIAFDKTGTLTEGKPTVTDFIQVSNRISTQKAISILYSIESLSSHPIAKALIKFAEHRKATRYEVKSFENIAGKGLKAIINSTQYYIGSPSWIAALGHKTPAIVDSLQRSGKTCLLMADDKDVLCVICLTDNPREEAAYTINHLKEHGIKPVMLTGDNVNVANAVASKLGIDEWYANLLPEDKLNILNKLKERFGSVAMVGDGINDAPALAKADVGIAMGAAGSDIAIESADIALMKDDITKVPYLVDLSIKTVKRLKENIISSILIKTSLGVLTFAGLTTLWIAVAIGDMGVSLAVILNALRVTRVKPVKRHYKIEKPLVLEYQIVQTRHT